MGLFQIQITFYRMKNVKYFKMLEVRGTCSYDINVTCISPKDNLLKFLKFAFRANFRFLLDLKKKDGKAFGKNTVMF